MASRAPPSASGSDRPARAGSYAASRYPAVGNGSPPRCHERPRVTRTSLHRRTTLLGCVNSRGGRWRGAHLMQGRMTPTRRAERTAKVKERVRHPRAVRGPRSASEGSRPVRDPDCSDGDRYSASAGLCGCFPEPLVCEPLRSVGSPSIAAPSPFRSADPAAVGPRRRTAGTPGHRRARPAALHHGEQPARKSLMRQGAG